MRSILSLILVVLACAGLGCQGAAPAGDEVRSLTILHVNDLHARLLPLPDGEAGFAHVAAAIRRHKAEAPERTLVLHGGDFVQGSPVSSIFEGVPVFEIANAMGFDANVLGNHEFDYGWRKIPEFLETGEFPTLAANVVNDEGELIAPPYVVKEVNGLRIGIIGVLTDELQHLTRSPLRGPWRALPIVETVQRYAAELAGETDLILVLAHIFNDEEDEILRHAPEADLIISGHDHGGQEEVKQIAGRICVKVRPYGLELGRLELKVDAGRGGIVSHKWRRIPVRGEDFPADPRTQALVEKWEAKVSEVVDVPIGASPREVGRHELQPVIEQVMAEAVGAELAYMNRGGIRESLPRGRLTKRDVWNILPFGNVIVYGVLAGREIPDEARRGRALDPDREYAVATNSFIAEKWRERGVELSRQGPVLREAFINWIKQERLAD